MKKLLSTILFAFMAVAMFAQSDETYRLVIHGKNGGTQSFAVNNVDSISFKKVVDKVGVNVDITEINNENPENEYIVVNIIPTEACAKYRFAVVPKVTSDTYGSSIDIMKMYFDPDPTLPTYTEALENATISGFNFHLVPGVTYAVMVLSYDELGTACNAQVFEFTVPAEPLVGNPSVDCHIDDVTATTVTITFTPNADCAGYYTCFFEPGLAEKQFNEFGPIMGFACMGDMIKSFGQELHTDVFTITWDQLAAGVPYEVYVQPLDANGNYAPMVNAIAETVKIGGEGLAEMSIELGALTWDEEYKSYFQEISFVPNDQTAAHRDIVAKKSAFDDGTWTEEKLLDYMKHDKNPDYPDFIEDPEWDNYGVHKGEFPVTPGQTYYIYTIGKNLNGEYGPFTKKEFTPDPDAPKTMLRNAVKGSFVKERGVSKNVKLGKGRVFDRINVMK